jgi:hypothetical protein
METEIKEYNRQEAMALITGRKSTKLFYYNVFGWSNYFTLEPTFATPSGKLWNSGFPRIVKIGIDGEFTPTKLIEL